MSAWGTTGRVTLEGCEPNPSAAPDVLVDGELVGWVGYPRDYPEQQGSDWWATVYNRGDRGYRNIFTLPSLDAAVMWVLRRAAPDVWRQERGPVWRVSPMWHVAAFDNLAGPRPRCAATGWLVEGRQRGDDWDVLDDWRTAVITAERYAKAAIAREVTP